MARTGQNKGAPTEEELTQLVVKAEQITEPVFILNLAISMTNTFLLSTSGQLYSWGGRGSILGRAAFTVQEAQKPTIINNITKILSISAGTNHILALDYRGVIYSWGDSSFGQLGHGDQVEHRQPKEIEHFKDRHHHPVIAIYAGGDSSYCLQKKGSGAFYVWGDNRNYQLGVLGAYLMKPTKLKVYPWDKHINKELKLVYGKANQAFFFQGINQVNQLVEFKQSEESAEQKKIFQENKLLEYAAKIEKLDQEIQDLQLRAYGQTPEQIKEDKIKSVKEDNLLKCIQQQIISVGSEIANKENQIFKGEEELVQLAREIDNIKSQLIEITEKENSLISERDAIENNLRKVARSKQGPGGPPDPAQEKLNKDQKRIKELLQANDNIKNTLIKRQNDSDTNRMDKTEMQKYNQRQKENLILRLDLFRKMEEERKKTIKTAYLSDNKADLEKFMVKVYYFYKSMQDTNISEIAKKSNQIIGLEEMITQSNAKLKYIKQELQVFRISPNDGSYEILSRILEILQDNLNTRLKLNDYIWGLLVQVSQRNEEQVAQFKDKYEKKQKNGQKQTNESLPYAQQITNMKNQLAVTAANQQNIKRYSKELLQYNQAPQSASTKGRGCIG